MPGVNNNLPCVAYTGDETFAFISYAHLDAEFVYPEIRRFDLMGYRIWYDEGIDPGNEWPEEIANALNRSSQFLVFVTQRSVNSRNVRNEINYALKLNKSFLAIHLDHTELPPGMELQMSSIQAIIKWQMNEQTYIRNLEKVLPRALGLPSNSTNKRDFDEVDMIVELFARTMHSEYESRMMISQRQNWHQLNSEEKSKKLLQSHFLLSMLHIAGFNICKAQDLDIPYVFTNDILDILSRLEHDRWSRQQIDAGWRYSIRKDKVKLLTPYIIPWLDIDEQVRDYDRAVVLELPELLLKSGYTIKSIYDYPESITLFKLVISK